MSSLMPGIVGAGAVTGFCADMLAGFIVLGYIMYGTDRLMGRKITSYNPPKRP